MNLAELQAAFSAFRDAVSFLGEHLANHPDPVAGQSESNITKIVDTLSGFATELHSIHSALTGGAAWPGPPEPQQPLTPPPPLPADPPLTARSN